jgi:hypothetical protein
MNKDIQDLRCFHDHRNSARLDCLLYGDGDLFCEAFLYLQTTTERLRNTCKLRQAKDKFIWNVRYGNLMVKNIPVSTWSWCTAQHTHFTGERYEVVLTKTGDIYVANNDHLIMVFRENSVIDDI